MKTLKELGSRMKKSDVVVFKSDGQLGIIKEVLFYSMEVETGFFFDEGYGPYRQIVPGVRPDEIEVIGHMNR
jgi:hypothetical protein